MKYVEAVTKKSGGKRRVLYANVHANTGNTHIAACSGKDRRPAQTGGLQDPQGAGCSR